MQSPTISDLIAAVRGSNLDLVRSILHAKPDLLHTDVSESDEHRALHYAVLNRDFPMTRLLMEAGADARKGIFPHRDATSALTLAREREFDEIVAAIETEEQHRREELSCPNATISPAQDQISAHIARGDSTAAIRLLEANPSLIQACDRDGGSPLHIAAEAGDTALVRWLLDNRADARKEDMDGLTALDRSALGADPRNGSAEKFPSIAAQLLSHGAEETIYAAVALGNEPRVAELIRAHPDYLKNIRQNGGLLTLAVNHNQLAVAKLLLDLGADPDERTLLRALETPTPTWGMPLWYAALANRHDFVEMLLERGADPNANVYASGWPLRNAWNHKDGSVKSLLLARGARMQPYMVAETHDAEQAKRLLESNASEELASELAWSAADHGCAAIVTLALSRLEWPPHDARWHWVIIQPIRGAGPDHDRNTGHFASMAAILHHGIDSNVARFGQTALHFAAGRQSTLSDTDRAQFASMLLDAGARLDLRDDLLQSTPLGWACRWGRLELVELLLQRGASVNEGEAQPWATPVSWAAKRGHTAIAETLARASS